MNSAKSMTAWAKEWNSIEWPARSSRCKLLHGGKYVHIVLRDSDEYRRGFLRKRAAGDTTASVDQRESWGKLSASWRSTTPMENLYRKRTL